VKTETRPLNPAEVAELLAVSRGTVYRLVHEASLPAFQFGTGGSLRNPQTTWSGGLPLAA
jgi:excisionase family DNA binding protein